MGLLNAIFPVKIRLMSTQSLIGLRTYSCRSTHLSLEHNVVKPIG